MDKETIEIKGPKTPVTGFLSNESYHRFKLDERTWKSVEHYFQAQKFVGTQLEEEIRKASTIHQVKNMVKQRRLLAEEQGKVVKKPVYGKDKQYRIRKDWNQVKKSVLREAIKAKFAQNKQLQKRLLETGDTRLLDPTNPDTGPILEEIRKSYVESPKTPPRTVFHGDVSSSKLTDQEQLLVQTIIRLAEKVSNAEGWKGQIYPGMVEDAVYTLTRKKYHEFLKIFPQALTLKWGTIYTQMPQFKTLVLEIQQLLPFATIQRRQVAIVLGILVKEYRTWPLFGHKSTLKRLYEVHKNFEGTKVRFLKKQRGYRKGTPPKIPKQTLTSKEKKYIEIAIKEMKEDPEKRSEEAFKEIMTKMGMKEALKKKDFFITYHKILAKVHGVPESSVIKELKEKGVSKKLLSTLTKPERTRKKIPEELTLKGERSRDIVVIGKPLTDPIHRQNLLRLGGKHPKVKGKIDRTKIRFPGYLKSDVENYIFSSLSSEKKWSIAIKLWQANKYLTLLDTFVQVTKLKEPKDSLITGKVSSFVLNQLYRCSIKKLEYPEKSLRKCVSQMMKNRYPEFKLDKKALKLVVQYVETIKDKLEQPKNDLGRRTYLLKMDEQVGWGSIYTGTIDTQEVLKKLAKTLSLFLDRDIDEKVCKGAFMVLLPPISVKLGAKQYINTFIKELKQYGAEKVSQQYGITAGKEDCDLILQITSRYIDNLMKKPELSWLSRRIVMMAGGENKACTSLYTMKDLTEDRMALIYDEVLDPLDLSDDDYAKVIEKWSKLSKKELLKVLNDPSTPLLD